jgi:hypothetical protein
MAAAPRLGKKPEFKGEFDNPDIALLQKTINRQVTQSSYGVVLPPSFLRRESSRGDVQYSMLVAAYNRVGYLCDLADDPNKKEADRLKAIAMMFQYGVGERINVTLTDSETIRVVCRVLANKFTDVEMTEFMDTLKLELEKAGA